MDTQDQKALLLLKKEWLEKMLSLTQQFSRLLEADRIEEFAQGLKSREVIIAKIDELAKKERKQKSRRDEETDALFSQTQDLIRAIMKLDAMNADLAEKKINLYKQQIKSLNEGKKGIGNYAKSGKSDDAFYVDAKK